MADVAFVAVIVVFFAAAVLFVRACDRIVGPDEEPAAHAAVSSSEGEAGRVAA